MTSKQIQSIGHFLAFYKTDLNYILQFQNLKNGIISLDSYVEKEKGSFYSFLIEFRVARNFKSGEIKNLLGETLDWVNSERPNDVDLFARKLSQTNITRNKVMASMTSKILFLNNPWEIIPMDSLARKTLKQKDNNYLIYKNNLEIFGRENRHLLDQSAEYTKPLAEIIHKDFSQLENIETIFRNRLKDKLLWASGK